MAIPSKGIFLEKVPNTPFLSSMWRMRGRWGLGALIVLAVLFIHKQYFTASNIPWALDDARMYLLYFTNRFIEGESFFDKVRYFFSETNYPHTKFTGRVISFLQYSVTGTVNFKFLIMVGSLALVGFVFLAKRLTTLEYWALIPLALILFTPGKMTLWVGPITGYPFLLIYALASFYLLAKGQYLWASIIAIITSFTHSPGMLIFIAAVPIFLLKENRGRGLVIWVAAGLVTVTLYYSEIISKGTIVRAEDPRTIMNIIQCSGSMIVYQGKFLTLPFVGNFYGLGNISKIQGLAAIVSMGVLTVLTTVLLLKRKAFDKRLVVALAFLLFCMVPGPISALVSDDCSSFVDIVAPRYTMYALMSWCGIYIFLMTAASKKWAVILPLIFIFMFLPKFYTGYKNADDLHRTVEYLWIQRASLNNDSPRGRVEARILIDSKNSGLYTPFLPPYPVANTYVGVIEELPLEFWYDLTINDHYCKLEVLMDKEAVSVEIWVGKGELQSRYVPKKISPVRIFFGNRKHYADNDIFPKTQKASLRYSGYHFVQPTGQGCEDAIRLKSGNRVSPILKATQ